MKFVVPYCGDKGVVLGRRLRGDAEVVRREAREIGGVADEDAVLACQVFLQFGRRCLTNGAQEEIGLSLLGFYTLNLVQQGAQTLGLGQVGRQVRNGGFASLRRSSNHRPGSR